ncbi:MAG: PAS domain S-box protein, partial [Candidatus Thiodiazotropha sp. (ex Ctena orbiculata)]|nr:PAS domain S-box protein [Candidatus Thiodiazotropha taylori]
MPYPKTLQDVVTNADQEIYWVEKSSCFVELNSASCEALGYAKSELLGQPLSKVCRSLSARSWGELLDKLRLRDGHHQIRASHCRKDGSEYLVELHLSLITVRSEDVICCVRTDSGVRKPVKQPQDEQYQKMQFLLEMVNGISWTYDLLDQHFLFVSQSAERILGYPPEVWTDMQSWVDMIIPEDRDYALGFCEERTAAGQDHTFEYRIKKSNGEIVWVLDLVTVVTDENNRPVKLTGIILDNSEQRKMLEEIKESERAAQLALERYRAVIETSRDGFWVTDRLGRILETNRAYSDISGYTPEELKQMSIGQLEAIESDDDVTAHIKKIVAEGNDLFETAHRRKDGSKWPVEASISYSEVE